ncbi:uncharacterized protein LOC118645232 [Monomorium pharaonis]|uniref:uncharacterized protein LOC118645232 n=1 Tax=Monomorium pharaonis TaxID=307658 RepID=UPI001747391E|nr:uncharacterized protein LOC118645232 [Monomorium pharaonis]
MYCHYIIVTFHVFLHVVAANNMRLKADGQHTLAVDPPGFGLRGRVPSQTRWFLRLVPGWCGGCFVPGGRSQAAAARRRISVDCPDRRLAQEFTRKLAGFVTQDVMRVRRRMIESLNSALKFL